MREEALAGEREPRDRVFTLVVHYRASDDRDESISLSTLACFPQIPIFHAVGGCGRGGLNCGDSRRTIAIFSLRTATDRATGAGAGSKDERGGEPPTTARAAFFP